MMKRTLMLLLVAMLVFGLVACSQPAGSEETTEAAASEEAVEASPADEPAESEEAPAAPVAEEVQGVTIPEFSVLVNGVPVTQEEMGAYPMYSVTATSVNSSGTETTTTYVGFAIADVYEAAGLTENFIWVQAIADDGYAVTMTGDVVMADTTLLAMTQDGAPFAGGPWFAPCSSGTSGEYLKNAISILVNTVEEAPAVDVPETVADSENESEAAAGELPEILDRTDKVEFAPFSFLVNGEEVNNDTLTGLSIYKITATVTNNKGETEQADYTGYKLADVLEAVGAGTANVTAVANDGFESTLTADMVSGDHTLIAIEKDKETGEDGTVWVAPCAQQTAGSFVKLVVEILAE